MPSIWTFAGVVCLAFAAVGCGPSMADKIRQQNERSAVVVSIPRSMNNAEDAPDIKDDASKVVSVMQRSYYIGREQYPIDALGDKVQRMLKGNPNAPVYFQGDAAEDFSEIAMVLDSIRKAGGKDIALLVLNDDRGPSHRLMVELLPEPAEDAKPDPNSLEVSFAKDDKLIIKGKDAGTAGETDKLIDAVKGAGGKPVTIKARRTTRYVDVVRAVNAAKGAGATSINLAIDDLS